MRLRNLVIFLILCIFVSGCATIAKTVMDGQYHEAEGTFPELEKGKAKCSGDKNPEKCKASLDSKVAKEKGKLAKMEAKARA